MKNAYNMYFSPIRLAKVKKCLITQYCQEYRVFSPTVGGRGVSDSDFLKDQKPCLNKYVYLLTQLDSMYQGKTCICFAHICISLFSLQLFVYEKVEATIEDRLNNLWNAHKMGAHTAVKNNEADVCILIWEALWDIIIEQLCLVWCCLLCRKKKKYNLYWMEASIDINTYMLVDSQNTFESKQKRLLTMVTFGEWTQEWGKANMCFLAYPLSVYNSFIVNMYLLLKHSLKWVFLLVIVVKNT